MSAALQLAIEDAEYAAAKERMRVIWTKFHDNLQNLGRDLDPTMGAPYGFVAWTPQGKRDCPDPEAVSELGKVFQLYLEDCATVMEEIRTWRAAQTTQALREKVRSES